MGDNLVAAQALTIGVGMGEHVRTAGCLGLVLLRDVLYCVRWSQLCEMLMLVYNVFAA